MNAGAPLPGPASAAAARSPLPSRPAFASDGTLCFAPVGAVWNAPELHEAYSKMMVAALKLGYRHADWDAMMLTLHRLWAADFAFRPEQGRSEEVGAA